MAEPRKVVDWERIELDYRAGLLTLREMGARHGVAESAIRKRAKRDSWVRDLSAKIKAKADDLVRKQEVRKQVRTEERVSELREIEIGAEAIARIKLAHRTDIARSRALAMKLLEELEIQTDNLDLMKQLGELMHAPDENGKDRLNDLYRKAIELGSRTGVMKALGDTLKTLVGLERDAYGIAEAQKVDLTVHDAPGFDPAALAGKSDEELSLLYREAVNASS